VSRIRSLIAELCPNGVEFKRLGDLGVWYGGGTPSKHEDVYWRDGTIPWLSPKDMGKSILDGTTDKISEAALATAAVKIIPANSVAVVVRSSILDRTLPVALVPFRTTLNQDMKALLPHDGVIAAYLVHTLSSFTGAVLRACRKTGGSVASIQVPKLLNFRVPIPPLEIQREVVAVLDKFAGLETELEAELQAELATRRRQYAYYRDVLLAFDDVGERSKQASVRWVTLGEIGELVRGNGMPKSDFVSSGIGCIHYGQIYTQYGVWTDEATSFVSATTAQKLAKVDPGDLVITNTSENVDDVCKAVAWVGKSQIVTGGHATVLKHNQDAKYLSYYLSSSHFSAAKKKHATGTKVIDISAKNLAKIRIPLPPLDEQRRIVAILAKLDALVNDLSIGLTAELEARRQQYQYYRDRLFTFREAA
jgi:type I restriction enzyme, S subunit